MNSTVQVLSQDGEPLFKLKDSGPEKLDRPVACIYHQNKYIVSDWGNDCVKVYNKSGKCLYKIENQGKGDGQLCGLLECGFLEGGWVTDNFVAVWKSERQFTRQKQMKHCCNN